MPPATPVITSQGDVAALDDGTPFPSWAEVVLTGDSARESPVILKIEIEAGQPVVTAITVLRTGPGQSIGSTVLRAAGVKNLTEAAVARLVEVTFWMEKVRGGSIDAFSAITGSPLGNPNDPAMWEELASRKSAAGNTRRRHLITQRLLEEVAAVYQAAGPTFKSAPTTAVAEHFNTSHRNATRWVKEARERRLLPPYKEES